MDERTVSKARMSLETGGCPRIRAPARTCRVAQWRRRTLAPFAPHAVSACALTPRKVDDGPQLISLTVQHTNPGLAHSPDKAQIEVSSREVSKYGGSVGRRRPKLSNTSPYESIRRAGRLSHCPKKADSTCRQPLLRSLASKPRPFSKLKTPFLSRFSFVRSFDTRARLSLRSRQTPPLSFTSSFLATPSQPTGRGLVRD